MKSELRKYTPHLSALIIFAIITAIYFKPLFSGKELRQDDIARHKGMSKEIADYRVKFGTEPLWTNSMFGGMPAYQISTLYPGNWLSKLDPAFKLFLPHPGGYLFLYCLGFFILLLCLEVNPWLALVGGLAYGLSSYFLIIIEAGHNSKANALGYLPAMIGGVILLFRKKYWLGLAVTSLFTAMELNANHVQITYYGYMIVGFLILGYLVTAVKSKKLRDFIKALSLLVVATWIGVLPNAGNLMTTYEYGKYSTRGKSELTIAASQKNNKALDASGEETRLGESEAAREHYKQNVTSGLPVDYATQWSYGIGETFTFLIPDFKGGPSNAIRSADPGALKKVNPEYREQVGGSNAYFGDQPFTSGPVYIGAIVVFLALLAMFIVKNPVKWPLFIVTLLCTALGWGSNFLPLTNFFMHYVPGYNKFRAVSMIMVVAEFTLPLLALLAVNTMLGISDWSQKIRLRLINKEATFRQLIIISASVTAGFCLLAYLAPGIVNEFTATGEEENLVRRMVSAGNDESQVRPYVAELMPQLEVARKALFRSDAIRSFIFIVLAFGVLYMYFTKKIKAEIMMAALGLFIFIDLWTVDRRYLNEKSFITPEQNKQYMLGITLADEEILSDSALDYRVLNLTASTWQDAATSYYHKSVGGYHGAKLKKYQELIEFHLDREVDHFFRYANDAFSTDSGTKVLLSELPVINMLNTRYFILPGKGEQQLPLLNTMANGNVWFVKDLLVVPTADEEIIGLKKIDTKTQAITTARFKKNLNLKEHYPAKGSIKLISYRPDELVYESSSEEEEFAVFSEIYYPKGWNAYLDGEMNPHIGVNYVLRGMNIPAGKHKIVFRFEPDTYYTGNTLALAGSVLLLVTSGFSLFMNYKKKAKPGTPVAGSKAA